MPCCGNATSCKVDHAADLVAQVDERAERAKLGVADVDVAADVLDAAGQLPAQDLPDAALHVLVGQLADALGPDGDALEQRAGLVRPGLADGEHGVQVNVRLDQRRRYQAPAEVDGLRCGRAVVAGGDDHAVADADVGTAVLARDPRVAEDQVDHGAIISRAARLPSRAQLMIVTSFQRIALKTRHAELASQSLIRRTKYRLTIYRLPSYRPDHDDTAAARRGSIRR